MKNVVVVILLVALIADIGAFAGLGFGVGALNVSPNAAPSSDYSYTPSGTNGHISLYFVTAMFNVADGAQLLTGALPGGQSTEIDFGTSIFYNGGSCGANPGWPAWSNGNAGESSTIQQHYTITFSQPGVQFELDGQDFGPISGTSYTFNYSFAGDGSLTSWCIGSGWNTPGPGPMDNHTLFLINPPGGAITSALTVGITFETQGDFCMSPLVNLGGKLDGACLLANQRGAVGNQLGLALLDEGGWIADSSAQATYHSGYAQIKLVTPSNGLGFNGGKIVVSASTGYGGFEVCVLTPQPRAGGGRCDGNFSITTVPDGRTGFVVSWPIPDGTGQNSTINGWNDFAIQVTNEYEHVGYDSLIVDVSPLYAPGLPSITFLNSGKFFYPQPGDTVTLTIYANATSTSKPVTSIGIKVYYLAQGALPTYEPACGNWQTANCPYFTTLNGSDVTPSGSNLVGTYAFTVTPPPGAVTIAIEAAGFTSTQQGSGVAFFSMPITSTQCREGDPGCQLATSVTTWQTAGPILFSAALLIVAALIFLLVPLIWVRYTVVAVAIGGVVVLYIFGIYTGWFAPGGFFNQGVS